MQEPAWLRELIDDEDLAGLFSDDQEEVKSTVRHLVDRAAADLDLEERIVDLLDTSLEHRNDDTSASIWAAVILGEIGSTRAIPILQRGLALEDDELLQDAIAVALLRIGPPALDALMQSADDDAGLPYRRAVYGVLGMVGALEDGGLTRRVADFFESRIAPERRLEPSERAIEELAQAASRTGERRLLGPLREMLEADFGGQNGPLQDAIEWLDENPGGVAFVGAVAPWEERYGWLFEDRARRRAGTGRDDPEDED
jgi:HEAT repeat protein